MDLGGDPNNPDLNIAWKYLWTAKDTWLGPEQNLGAIGATYNLTMDPFEKYDMTFNGAVASRLPNPSPGNYAGQDNGWVLALIYPVVMEFNKSIVDYPSIKLSPGGASNRLSVGPEGSGTRHLVTVLQGGQELATSIQNGLCRSLISHNFLPKGDTNRRFRRTLRKQTLFRSE